MSSAEVFYRNVPCSDEPGGGYDSASIDDFYGEDDEPGELRFGGLNDWDPVGNILSVETSPSSPSPSTEGPKVTVYVVEGTQTVTAPNYQTVTVTKTFEATPTDSPYPGVMIRDRNERLRRDIPDPPVGFIGIFFRSAIVGCYCDLLCSPTYL